MQSTHGSGELSGEPVEREGAPPIPRGLASLAWARVWLRHEPASKLQIKQPFSDPKRSLASETTSRHYDPDL